MPISEKCRDFKGMLAEYKMGAEEKNEDTNNNNNNNRRGAEEHDRIYRILVKFKPIMKFHIYVAANLLDARFDESLFSEDEIKEAEEHLKKHANLMFDDDNIWDRSLRREYMNYRSKTGVWSRFEFVS